MTPAERAATVAIWTVTAAVVLVLLAPLVVTVAVSFSASPVFNLPPPERLIVEHPSAGKCLGLWRL